MNLTTEQLVANLIGSQQIEIITLKARIADLESQLARAGEAMMRRSEAKKHFIADPADEGDVMS